MSMDASRPRGKIISVRGQGRKNRWTATGGTVAFEVIRGRKEKKKDRKRDQITFSRRE